MSLPSERPVHRLNLRRILRFYLNTFSAVSAFTAISLTAASGAVSTENFSNYVVSWTGKYLFATVDTHQDPSLHQVFVIETEHPDQRTVIGDDYQGKGFAGIYCSKDERWLCVNLGVGVHAAECHIFKHVVERRFDKLNTTDINAKIKSLFESSASPGFTFDAVYGQYWKDDSLVLVANGRGQKDGNFYDDKMFLDYRPVNGHLIALSKHFVSPMAAGAGEKVDPEYERLEDAALKAYEESLQHQLKVIYALLLQKLGADAKGQLASDQKQWELERDKKPPGRYERDLFVQQRINNLAARFLENSPQRHEGHEEKVISNQ
jgi:hypothetical protein